MDFRIGDIVRLRDGWSNLTKGAEYTINYIGPGRDWGVTGTHADFIYPIITDDSGTLTAVHPAHMILVTEVLRTAIDAGADEYEDILAAQEAMNEV